MSESDEIIKRLDRIENELITIKENNYNQNLQTAIESIRDTYSNSIKKNFADNLGEKCSEFYLPNCKNEECKQFIVQEFKELFLNTQETDLNKLNEQLDEKFYSVCGVECSPCYNNFKEYFFEELKMINSINVSYELNENEPIEKLDVDMLISDVFEPLSSKQRVIIIESLYVENKSYTQLSHLTKLRGGNLLFHLEKLQDAGLISQKQDRGEYLLTKKGYTTLSLINQFQKLMTISGHIYTGYNVSLRKNLPSNIVFTVHEQISLYVSENLVIIMPTPIWNWSKGTRSDTILILR